jgi:hypothetical protein
MPYTDPVLRAEAAKVAQRRYRERHNREPVFLFKAHQANARSRGIPFLLTFEEWWGLWQASGKWDQRGNTSQQYCMARRGDVGGYEIDNVEIVTNFKNRGDRIRNKPIVGERNGAYGKNYWASSSAKERKLRKAAISAKLKGKPKGKQMSERLSKTATGRKKLVLPSGKWTWVYPE